MYFISHLSVVLLSAVSFIDAYSDFPVILQVEKLLREQGEVGGMEVGQGLYCGKRNCMRFEDPIFSAVV